MNTVLHTRSQVLLSLSAEELLGISSAVYEVCNGIAISDSEFQTRLGVTRSFLQTLLQDMPSPEEFQTETYQVVSVWEDSGAVMFKAVTVFGDPVELGEQESSDLLRNLTESIRSTNGATDA